MSKLNIKTKLLVGLSHLPLLVACDGATQNGGFLEEGSGVETREVSALSIVQRSGYLGRMSERAMLNGNLDVLGSVSSYIALLDDTQSVKEHIQLWHQVAIDAVALDHTPHPDIEDYSPSQGGPTRTSRALAMVQVAVFDSLNSIAPAYQPYTQVFNAGQNASAHTTIAYAAYSSLMALYPQQENRLNAVLNEVLGIVEQFTPEDSVNAGRSIGVAASNALRVVRSDDGSGHDEPNFGDGGLVSDGIYSYTGAFVNGESRLPGEWTPDPNTPDFAGDFNLSLGAYWGNVEPFVLEDGHQFRVPAPPVLDSQEFIDAYNAVAAIGGASDNAATPSTSTDETRFIANYWGYDGVPLIGVPPRIYNQISEQIADDEIDDPLAYARVLALVNLGMADAAIAAWDSKYYYNLWRPVMGIRSDDGVDATFDDPSWNPVGVSVVNTEESIRATPPFPAYPSGHSTFGAVTFGVLREIFADNTPFTFVSDEYNGEGVDPFFPEVPRPFVPVRFQSLTEAQIQNGISRIYNGVHWDFDDTAGQVLGGSIAQFMMNNAAVLSPGAPVDNTTDGGNGGDGNGNGNGDGGNGDGGNGDGGNGDGGNGNGGNGGGGNGNGGNGNGGNGDGGNGDGGNGNGGNGNGGNGGGGNGNGGNGG